MTFRTEHNIVWKTLLFLLLLSKLYVENFFVPKHVHIITFIIEAYKTSYPVEANNFPKYIHRLYN